MNSSIDDQLILEYFKGTLVSDPHIRRESELQLAKLHRLPGFLESCVKIINSHNGPIEYPVPKETQVACAVYFKNTINRYWGSGEIALADKPFIKSNFPQIMIDSNYNIKQQLLPTLRILIQSELHDWMDLLQTVNALLGDSFNMDSINNEVELNKVYTGMLCLSEISRSFRWMKNSQRQELELIIEEFFPRLLFIGECLSSDSANLNEFKAEILKLILRCYKFVTYLDLPQSLQTPASIIQWGQFHGSLVNMKLPAYVLNARLSENEKNQFQLSKVLKWSLANINRCATRYVTGSNFKYDQFKAVYVHEFLPYLVSNLVSIVEMWCAGTRWLNLSALYYLIEILRTSISLKNLWVPIKKILPHLVQYFMYPIIVPSDDKIETFDNDPHQYISLTFNVFLDDTNAPDTAAINFIKTLLQQRKKYSFGIIMSFIHDELLALVNMEETLDSAKKREAILRLVGSISGNLINSSENKFYDHMEEFLMKLVLPNVRSNYKFLVARTFEILGSFSDLEFKSEENLNLVIYEVLKNFGFNSHPIETDLAVVLENSLCLQSYLHIPQFKETLSVMVLQVISKLLEISNEIDNDTISVVIQECVETFGQELQPFGKELVDKLVRNFMRIVSEQEGDEKSDDYEGVDSNDDKVIAGIGILNTIVTVLISFEENRYVVRELTDKLIPMIKYILVHRNENYLSETCEIIENLVYLNKDVSQDMFDVLRLINDLINDGLGVMYFEEMLPALKNYLLYFEDEQPSPLDTEFIEIFLNVFIHMNENVESLGDSVLNFELIQYFILILKVKSVGYFNVIIGQLIPLFKVFDTPNPDVNLYFRISFLNIIICMLIYDSNFVIINLNEMFIKFFLGHWIQVIPKLTRCYDIKLSILGLISLINNNNLVANPDFATNLVYLLKTLPTAIRDLRKRRKQFIADFKDEFDGSRSTNAEDGDNYGSFGDSGDETEADEDIVNDDHCDFLDFLTQENLKLLSHEENIIEDPLETTPLDHVNLPEILKNFFSLLQTKKNDRYLELFGSIPEQELQGFIKKLIIASM
ncbi:Nonsense-mediated mRNA decay protein 5 [Yamadazyma tenuis]|uniref:ARM repeat-containing protein n=1 Tax=Candida tenuis (strain ATCC 10573 / BCRC 21748 / CBS 615 / JCM 9827 / NBRC 10315 / NRRL Y-1498 / VKM Y-70) TaxID=590646 RepID=G3AWY7_CANTC|nr:ARM repeat-containing protein [Yamadazyma tenuis ATCC 10573]EGV66646.1 ARM repeat-containing protein [Yamadazyma tenuis ATCC 10573]WEJ95226.1 Nonsense-mediated mRNA decay protein 5 [Yamadazyma tenuis]